MITPLFKNRIILINVSCLNRGFYNNKRVMMVIHNTHLITMFHIKHLGRLVIENIMYCMYIKPFFCINKITTCQIHEFKTVYPGCEYSKSKTSMNRFQITKSRKLMKPNHKSHWKVKTCENSESKYMYVKGKFFIFLLINYQKILTMHSMIYL